MNLATPIQVQFNKYLLNVHSMFNPGSTIHLFHKNFLNIYIVPGITADNRDRERNKIKILALMEIIF